MATSGEVTELKRWNIAVIRMERQEACAKCRACVAGLNPKDMFLNAKNNCHANIGDRVEIALARSNFLMAVVIMYIIPLFALLTGIGLGYALSNLYHLQQVELIAVLLGFAFLATTYLIIKKQEPKINKKKYQPAAVRIVKRRDDI